MTEKEVASIIRTLKAYYPYYYKGVTPEEAKAIIDAWMVQFKEFDYEIIKRAVDMWGGEKETPPSIAELKRYLFRLYGEFDREYSRLLKEGTKEEIAKMKRWRELTWNCARR